MKTWDRKINSSKIINIIHLHHGSTKEWNSLQKGKLQYFKFNQEKQFTRLGQLNIITPYHMACNIINGRIFFMGQLKPLKVPIEGRHLAKNLLR